MEKQLKRQYQFLAVDTLQTTWLFGLFCGLLLDYDETLPSEKANGYEELDLNILAAIIFFSWALEILGTVKKNNIAMIATLIMTTMIRPRGRKYSQNKQMLRFPAFYCSCRQ